MSHIKKIALAAYAVALLLVISTAASAGRINGGGGGSSGGVSSAVVCLLSGGANCTMTGQMLSVNGTAAAPGVTFAGDTGLNTGIYRVGEDNLGITTAGTERVRVSTTAMSNQAATGSFNIAFAAGTSSAPSYAYAGDLVTGAYRAAAGVNGQAGPSGHVIAPGAALAIGATDTTTAPNSAACRMSAAGAGSTWTPSETGAIDGRYVCCTNTGTNTITMTDSAGVYEGAAAASVVGQWDSVCFEYVTDRWVERSFSNN